MKREAKFTTLFHHWLKSGSMLSSAFEIKQTTGNTLPFGHVKDHQLDALLAVKKGRFAYKIPDDSRGIKPFDMFLMREAWAYVVVKYPEFFCLIDVEMFIREKKRSRRKSLTSGRAREIAERIIEL